LGEWSFKIFTLLILFIYCFPSLQACRRSSNVFAGKQGFITLRDLFRWAERYSKTPDVEGGGFHDWDQHLAEDGKYKSLF